MPCVSLQFAARELQDMFTSKDGARKDRNSYCIYDDSEMSRVTVSIGSNRTDFNDYAKYPPVEYADLPNKLGSVKNIGDWPTYWPFLLGQTLRDKWYQGDIPEEQVTLDNVEKYVIAYCEILTGEECIATGTVNPHTITKDGIETKWAEDVVHRILMRSRITVSFRLDVRYAFAHVLLTFLSTACDCH
jgi:hypothetical protein